jgi:uncharacterized protein (DUF2267 family)
MSTSGLAVFDHTIQETNIWLNAVAEQLQLDRHDAYMALRAVLHALRDRLPPEVVVHHGAQLPMLIRGFYYEGWHMAGKPIKDRHLEDFVEHVFKALPPKFPLDPLTVTRGVFAALWQRLDPGEFAKLMEHLPSALKALQPQV